MNVSKKSWHYQLVASTMLADNPAGSYGIETWSAYHYVVSVIMWCILLAFSSPVWVPLWLLYKAGMAIHEALVKKFDGVKVVD